LTDQSGLTKKLPLQADNVTAKSYYIGKKIISIIATLEEFRGMPFGADIHVFTEHKNRMFNTLKMQCMLCWHTKIEHFSSLNVIGPRQYCSHYHSRLHCLVTPAQIAEGQKLVEPTEVSNKERDEVYFLDQDYSCLLMY
jgi:hypothetical protein